MKTIVLWLTLLALFSAGASAQKQFVHTDGTRLVTPSGSTLLLRGTNLGNWLEPEGYMFLFEGGPVAPREIEGFFSELIGPAEAAKFWNQYREQFITERDVQFLQESGFNSVRIPLHYKFFRSDSSDGFRLLDRVIGWCRKAGLSVILDMHCAPGGQTGTNIDDSWGYPWLFESLESQQLTIDVWKRIAAHYREDTTVIGYDLLNEPIPQFPELPNYNDKLEPLYRRITAGIREVDRNHILIYGGAQWDGNFQVFGAPFDKNAMYTFHKYWTSPDQAAVQEYVKFRDKYHVPIWLGESGENTDEWITKFTKVLERNQIGWCFWPFKKMEKTSAPVSFVKPRYWEEILKYAAMPGGTGEAEKRLKARPSIEHSREALADLLEKVRFENCRVNGGYLKALGLH